MMDYNYHIIGKDVNGLVRTFFIFSELPVWIVGIIGLIGLMGLIGLIGF